MSKFIVNGVPLKKFFHIQTNNKYNPFVTCFPTSVAMVIDYILQIKKLHPADIGIDEEQIEDYITKLAKSRPIIDWMIKHVGPWTTQYIQKAWLVGRVEEKIFDQLMNALGYDSKFIDDMSYDELCQVLLETNIPQVICGDFTSSQKEYNHNVSGHIVCCIGYITETRTVIVHDPYGYALQKNYYDSNKPGSGFCVQYSWDRFFVKNKNTRTGWCLQIKPL